MWSCGEESWVHTASIDVDTTGLTMRIAEKGEDEGRLRGIAFPVIGVHERTSRFLSIFALNDAL